jgi:hypothetical protein
MHPSAQLSLGGLLPSRDRLLFTRQEYHNAVCKVKQTFLQG